MSNFVKELRTEISRVAKRESRAEVVILKKAASQSKAEISALKRRVADLETSIRALSKKLSQPARKDKELVSSDLRFRASGFVSLRKRLNLTAVEMARLIGVSSQSVYLWESGKSRPRAVQLKSIAEIRKLGKKKVAQMLEAK